MEKVKTNIKKIIAAIIIIISIIVGILTVPTFHPSTPSVGELTTWYMRSDQHTVNGLTAYILNETQSSSSLSVSDTYSSTSGYKTTYVAAKVFVRHSDGTETEISTEWYIRVDRSEDGEGLQSDTWTCPEENLDGDAIVVKIYTSFDALTYTLKATFISDTLTGTIKGTWNFYFYTKRSTSSTYNPKTGQTTYYTYVYFYWGDSTYNSHIEDVEVYSPPQASNAGKTEENVQGENATFYSYWTVEQANLSMAFLCFKVDNVWDNSTSYTFPSGTSSGWSNWTVQLDWVGKNVEWLIKANSSDNVWGYTSLQSFYCYPAFSDLRYNFQRKTGRTSDGTIHYVGIDVYNGKLLWMYSSDHENWTCKELSGDYYPALYPTLYIDANNNITFAWNYNNGSIFIRQAKVNTSSSPYTWTLQSIHKVEHSLYSAALIWYPTLYVSPNNVIHVGFYSKNYHGVWSYSKDGGNTWTCQVFTHAPVNSTAVLLGERNDKEDLWVFLANINGTSYLNATYIDYSSGTDSYTVGTYYNVTNLNSNVYPPSVCMIPENDVYGFAGVAYSNGSALWFKRSTNPQDASEWQSAKVLTTQLSSQWDFSTVAYESSIIRVYYSTTELHSNGDIAYRESQNFGNSFFEEQFITAREETDRYPNVGVTGSYDSEVYDLLYQNDTSRYVFKITEAASHYPLLFSTALLTSATTSHSYATHIGYAASRYWTIYADTDKKLQIRSTIDGKYWTDPFDAGYTLDSDVIGDSFYTYYENRSGDYYLHVMHTGEESSSPLIYRCFQLYSNGTVNPLTSSWQTVEEAITGGYWVLGCTVDNDGYPYLFYCKGGENLTLAKSSYNNGTWEMADGFPKLVKEGGYSGWIVWVKNGTYLVYDLQTTGDLYGKFYNATSDSFSSEEQLNVNGVVKGTPDRRGLSIDVANDVVYIVYTNDTYNFYRTKNFTDGSLSSEQIIYEGNANPVIHSNSEIVKAYFCTTTGVWCETLTQNGWSDKALIFNGSISSQDYIDIIKERKGDLGIAVAIVPNLWVHPLWVIFETQTYLTVGWNQVPATILDVGHNLYDVGRSLKGDNIQWDIIKINYTDGSQAELDYNNGTYTGQDGATVTSTGDILLIHCITAGGWSHEYPPPLETSLEVGWNSITVFDIDYGRTLVNINASLHLDSINFTVVTFHYSNGTEISLVWIQTTDEYYVENATMTVTSDTTIWIYCKEAGEWHHTYGS